MEEFKSTATLVLGLTNRFGISIMLNESGTELYYKYSDSDIVKRAEVIERHGEDVSYYFETDTGVEYYLEEFCKVI